MSLEAFTGWIKDLVAGNPTGTDSKSQGDDHIRGLKATLKAQFSGLTQGKAVTVTEDELNSVVARVLRAGDTMTGPLVLAANAAAPLQAVPLQQLQAAADTKVNKSGDTMTGPLLAPAITVVGDNTSLNVGNGDRSIGVVRTSGSIDGFAHYKNGAAFDGWFLQLNADAFGHVVSMRFGSPGTHIYMDSYIDLVRDAVDSMEPVTKRQLDAVAIPTVWQHGLNRVGSTTYANPSVSRKLQVLIQALDGSGPKDVLVNGVSFGVWGVGYQFTVPEGGNYRIGTEAFHNTNVSELLL
jgi:hypothetical protein